MQNNNKENNQKPQLRVADSQESVAQQASTSSGASASARAAKEVQKHHPPHSYQVIKGLKEVNAALTRRLKEAEKKVDLNRKKARDKRGPVVPQGAPLGTIAGVLGGALAATATTALVRALQKVGNASDEVGNTLVEFRKSVLAHIPTAKGALKKLAVVACGLVAVKAIAEAGVQLSSRALLRVVEVVVGRKFDPPDIDVPEPQAGGVPLWAYGLLVMLLVVPGKTFTGRFYTVSWWGRIGKGVQQFVELSMPIGDWLGSVLDKLDEWLRGNSAWGLPNFLTALYKPRLEFRKQLHELTVLSVSLRAKLLMTREANVQNVALARKMVRDVALLRSHPECKGGSIREVDTLLKNVEELARGLQTSVAFNTSKPEPVMVLLVGEPGVGKTAVTPFITAELVKRCASPEQVLACNGDYNREVYNRNASDQYMSGYNMQMVTVMDDFAQQRADAMAGGMSDFMWVITNVNSHASQLNMAGLEQKGCTPFVSRAVVATANKTALCDAHKVIKDPQALYRRIKYTFVVSLKGGGQLDYGAMRRGPNGELPDLWDFELVPAHTLDSAGTKYSLERAVQLIADEVNNRQQLFDQVHSEDAAAQKALRKEMEELDKTIKAAYKPGATAKDPDPQGGPLPWGYKPLEPLDDWQGQALKLLASGGVHGHDYDYFTLVGMKHDMNLDTVLQRYRALRTWVHPDRARGRETSSRLVGEGESAAFSTYVNSVANAAEEVLSSDYVSFYRAFAARGKAALFDSEDAEMMALCLQRNPGTVGLIIITTLLAAVGTTWLIVTAVRAVAHLFNGLVAGLKAVFGKRKEEPVVAQSALNPDRKRLIEANVVVVERRARNSSEWIRVGQVLGLRDELVLGPRHFARCVEMDDDVMLTQLSGEPQVVTGRAFAASMQAGVSVRAEDDDMVVAPLTGVRRFRDVTKHLLEWKEGDKQWLNNAVVLRLSRGARGLDVNAASPSKLKLLQVQAVNNVGVISDVIEQQQDFHFGSCGALLVTGGKSGGLVMGLYVAGGNKKGYYRSVRSHEVLRALEQAGNHVVPQGTPLGGLIEVGLATYPVFVPTETKLVRTGMEEEVGMGDHRPALLKSQGDVHPMANALAPYGKEPVLLSATQRAHLTEAVAEVATAVIGTSECMHYADVLSFEQALDGVPELGLRAVDAATSPGYPWVQRGYAKSALMKQGTRENAELRDVHDRLEKRLLEPGTEPARVYYATFLKDELRSLEKVELGKTRPIHGAPLELVVLYRRYFGAFEAALKAGRVVNGIGVGVNPHSDWGTVSAHLGTAGKPLLASPVFAGDYTAFDASQSPWLFRAYADIANEWYAAKGSDDPTAAHVRVELMRTLERPWIVVGRKVFRMRRGLPSGHPGTACINSVSNLVLLAMAYKALGAPGRMLDECHAVVWGDDHVVAPSTAAAAVFNQNSVVAPLQALGFTYTPETKEATAPDLRELGEVELLKRRFTRGVDGTIVAPLRLDSILKSVRWAREPNNTSETLEQNCRAALVELAKHAPEVWERWAPAIRNGCRRLTGVSLPEVHGAQEYWLKQWSSVELPDWMY